MRRSNRREGARARGGLVGRRGDGCRCLVVVGMVARFAPAAFAPSVARLQATFLPRHACMLPQVAFADRLLVNKIDLVREEDLERVESKLRKINKYAPILRCQNASVGMANVLDLKAFELERVLEMDPEFLSDGEHMHDETVSSVGFKQEGNLNMERTNTWIAKLLQEKGVDIYRMKGVLSMAGVDDKYVFQGVHMLFTGEALGPWGEEKRVNRLIFIGKNLDKAALEAGFAGCLEAP